MTQIDGASATVPSPWLWIVGPHRSGMSAFAKAAQGSGFALPLGDGQHPSADREGPPDADVPELGSLCDLLLAEMGGSWFVPPEVRGEGPEFEHVARLARSLLSTVLPDAPVVWTDARLALLVRFFRRTAPPRPTGVVFVYREPLSAAMSLHNVQGLELEHCLALFELYIRAALADLAWLPVFIVRYEHVLAAPTLIARGLTALSTSIGFPESTDRSVAASVDAVRDSLCHERWDAGSLRRRRGDAELVEFRESLDPLMGYLDSHSGFHRGFNPVDLPPPTEKSMTLVGRYREILADCDDEHRGIVAVPRTHPPTWIAAGPGEAFRTRQALPCTATPTRASEGASPGSPPAEPLATFVVPVRVAGAELATTLEMVLGSLSRQHDPGFEVCVVVGSASDERSAARLQELAGGRNVRVEPLEGSWELGKAAAQAFGTARGRFVCLLDERTAPDEHCLCILRQLDNRSPHADVVYCDEWLTDLGGEPFARSGRPEWSPDLIWSEAYLGRGVFFRRSSLEIAGGFQPGSAAGVELDALLRIQETWPDDRAAGEPSPSGSPSGQVVHIPLPLVRRFCADTGSFSDAPSIADHDERRRALERALERRRLWATIHPGPLPATFHVTWPLPAEVHVSIGYLLEDTEDFSKFLALTIEELSGEVWREANARVEVLAIPFGGMEFVSARRTLDLAVEPGRDLTVRFLDPAREEGAAFARNAAVTEAAGEITVLVGPGAHPVRTGWIEALVSLAARPGVGLVGGVLEGFWSGVASAGMSFEPDGAPRSLDVAPGDSRTWRRIAELDRNASAVSASACAFITPVVREIGGFPVSMSPFDDVALCLELTKRGYRHIVAPHARFTDKCADRDGRRAPVVLRGRIAEFVGSSGLYCPDPFVPYVVMDRD